MTRRVVLIGHPVAHSLSGAMQQAAFDDQGIDATYELWDRPPIGLPDAVNELRTDDFLGANVTIPHKERMVPLVDRLTEEAHATGAVNTITKEGKRLVGHNTDVPGFKVALDKLVGKQKMPRAAVESPRVAPAPDPFAAFVPERAAVVVEPARSQRVAGRLQATVNAFLSVVCVRTT